MDYLDDVIEALIREDGGMASDADLDFLAIWRASSDQRRAHLADIDRTQVRRLTDDDLLDELLRARENPFLVDRLTAAVDEAEHRAAAVARSSDRSPWWRRRRRSAVVRSRRSGRRR